AISLNRINSTAPSAKLGATRTPTCGCDASSCSTAASFSSSKPLVPTTTLMPASTQNRTLSSTASGCVKSTATCAPASVNAVSGSSTSTRATSCKSSAPSTASHTVEPTRPAAPSTPTLITSSVAALVT